MDFLTQGCKSRVLETWTPIKQNKKNQSDSLSFNLKTFTFTFLLCENELGHSSPELQQLVKRVH